MRIGFPFELREPRSLMRPGPPNSVRSAESRSLEAEFGSGQDGVTTFVPTPNADSSTASRLVLVSREDREIHGK